MSDLGEEVEELLDALRKVERYMRYLDMRASGDAYVAWGIVVAVGCLLTALVSELGSRFGLPIGPVIGILWAVLMTIAIAVSSRGWGLLWAFLLAHKPPEEREQLRRSWRVRGTVLIAGWAGTFVLWGFLSLFVLGGEPGPCWSIYLACVGLGNAITYAVHSGEERRMIRESLVVAAVLLACSPLPFLIVLALPGWPWLSFTVAVLAVIISYLWAGLRFYEKAEAILAGAPEG
ncbi:hypothetical protein DRO33_04430 [Candidatus Bathyarchaeota archaeon]|nr:MAG: hypothetical protein DRO33_04430 [Candidatus Bathyarchaeota archaeon]